MHKVSLHWGLINHSGKTVTLKWRKLAGTLITGSMLAGIVRDRGHQVLSEERPGEVGDINLEASLLGMCNPHLGTSNVVQTQVGDTLQTNSPMFLPSHEN